MSESKTKTKTKVPKTKASEAAPVATKPKKEKAPKEDLVVFACRVAETERAAFHRATGPAGASRFARRLMVVFTEESVDSFKALIEEARMMRA